MDNIPKGYDEEGHRLPHGWLDEVDNEDTDDYIGEELKNIFSDESPSEHYREEKVAECYRCGNYVDESEASKLDYGTGYICSNCSEEMGMN